MFEDVKVGDTVYTQDEVPAGNRQVRLFWTPKKVARVTKTQFILENGVRFRKRDGEEISNAFYGKTARRLGDYYGNEIVTDQSEEKASFVKKVKAFRQARESLKKIWIDINQENFDEIVDTIKRLEELMDVKVKAQSLTQNRSRCSNEYEQQIVEELTNEYFE